jgi:hypothetical protein
MEWMSARSTPRRSSRRQAQERVSQMRRRVPWVEAEQRRVAEWFRERQARLFSCAVMREMFVGRFWWWLGVDWVGVRSTSWMWPGERPGKANRDRVGEGERAHNPMDS